MNDLERKLAAQPFRTPPADLRRAVLAACEPAPRAVWREWLWPSPVAWGALAAVWLAFFAVDAADRASAPRVQDSPARLFDEKALRSSPLLAPRSPHQIRHVLELSH